MPDPRSENNYNELNSKLLKELINIVPAYKAIPINNSNNKKKFRLQNTTILSNDIKLTASLSILKIACSTFIKNLSNNHNNKINSEKDLDNFLSTTADDICNILHSIDPVLQENVFDLAKPQRSILHQIITNKVIAHLQPVFNDIKAHLKSFEKNINSLNKVTNEDQDKKEVYSLLITSMKNGLQELSTRPKPDKSSHSAPTHTR